MRHRILFASTLCCLLSAVSATMADGCYIPERAVRKIPEIPAQRALLAWHDGTETLIISSALDSESQKLGWIIPLPSVPDTMEKASPGTLKTLTFCIQPRITHDRSSELGALVFLVYIGNLLLATLLFKRKRFQELLVLLLVSLLLAAMLLPSASAHRGNISSRSGTVSVEKTAKVGAYDVAVLRSESAKDLDTWLTSNGFAVLPEKAAAIVADYIEEDWVFAAIKLTRRETGRNSPHPIRLEFASEQPVYPLRLTSIAGGSTAFELFVLGDGRAATDLLEIEFCDRFRKRTLPKGRYGNYESPYTCPGKETEVEIGHPALADLVWNDAVMTKLSGSIDAADMTADVFLEWEPFHAYRQHLYTANGAHSSAWIVFVLFMGACFFVSMIVFRKKLRQQENLPRYFLHVFLPLAGISGLAAFVFYSAVPKLPSDEVQVSRRFAGMRHVYDLIGQMPRVVEDTPPSPDKTDVEIANDILDGVSRGIGLRRPPRPRGLLGRSTNPITGAALEISDTPGNFTVERNGSNLVIRVYDEIGRPIRVELPVGDET
jgi:hypothetical protein